ncbi:MAG: hypothetical protein FWD57_16120, partial [Polyangiaceae bacterium]|nr:hypothetical protein [Polyangiaceae bacterium]
MRYCLPLGCLAIALLSLSCSSDNPCSGTTPNDSDGPSAQTGSGAQVFPPRVTHPGVADGESSSGGPG